MSTNTGDHEIYSIPLNAKQNIIYAPLKRIAFIGNHSLVNELVKSIQSGTRSNELQFLDNTGFFQPDMKIEDKFAKTGIQYDSAILFLTNTCQLNCLYCYANSGDFPITNMTWDIAKTAIDFVIKEIIKNQLKSMTLGFHGGGEPSMNWEILTKAVDYTYSICKQKKINLVVSGAFNGFWNENQLSYITKKFTDINISFDGIKKVQNKHRPTKYGKSSFEKVIHSIRTIQKANLRYGIRMTVTKYSVKYLAESIKYICDNFKPSVIQVEPVFNKGRAVNFDCEIDNLEFFIQEFIKAYLMAEENNIELFYSGARINLLTDRFCLAPCKALIVTPEGYITSCFEIYSHKHQLSESYIVGNIINNQVFINKTKVLKFFNRTVEKIPLCENCFCKWHCAGDCAAKTDTEYTEYNKETDRCFITKEIIKFQILNKIYKNGGVFWVNNLKLNSYEKQTVL